LSVITTTSSSSLTDGENVGYADVGEYVGIIVSTGFTGLSVSELEGLNVGSEYVGLKLGNIVVAFGDGSFVVVVGDQVGKYVDGGSGISSGSVVDGV